MFISSSLKILILPWQYDLGHSHSFYPLVSTTKELNVGEKKELNVLETVLKRFTAYNSCTVAATQPFFHSFLCLS